MTTRLPYSPVVLYHASAERKDGAMAAYESLGMHETHYRLYEEEFLPRP